MSSFRFIEGLSQTRGVVRAFQHAYVLYKISCSSTDSTNCNIAHRKSPISAHTSIVCAALTSHQHPFACSAVPSTPRTAVFEATFAYARAALSNQLSGGQGSDMAQLARSLARLGLQPSMALRGLPAHSDAVYILLVLCIDAWPDRIQCMSQGEVPACRFVTSAQFSSRPKLSRSSLEGQRRRTVIGKCTCIG